VSKIKKVIKQPIDPIELPTYDSRYSAIMEHAQVVDPLAEWKSIRSWLQAIPVSIQDIRELVKQHADNAERAKRLASCAELELKVYELKCTDRKQIWRISAISHWETQKEGGHITKQITEKMIEDWIIEQHSDLYIELEKRRLELDATYKQLKSLVSQVNSKGHDLRKLLESETRRPSGSPNWMDDAK